MRHLGEDGLWRMVAQFAVSFADLDKMKVKKCSEDDASYHAASNRVSSKRLRQ